MPVPDFQTVMRPLLQAFADGSPRRVAEAEEQLGEHFGLTDDELAEMLPSGKQQKFKNRVRWAATYLKNARALERQERGIYRITQRGIDLLADNPEHIGVATLSQFDEFREFHTGAAASGTQPTDKGSEVVVQVSTPEELMAEAASALRLALVSELQERITSLTPGGFERLVMDVLAAMSYGSAGSLHRTGGPGDAGIDGVIQEDRLGLDAIYVQAKKWTSPVARPDVQGFVGALQGARATKGIMFTASTFTTGAVEYATHVSPRVVLVDGRRLAELMVDHDVGVSTRDTFEVKRVDSDYFSDEAL